MGKGAHRIKYVISTINYQEKMRTLIIILAVMANLYTFAQHKESSLVTRSAYYISIDIYSNKNHATMFDMVLDQKDSLLLNIRDKESFIKNALANTIYVPRLWSYDAFRKYYNDIDVKDSFRNIFFDKLEKYGTKLTLMLKSGETVRISYIFLRGVFAQFENQISFSHGLDNEDTPKVSKPCIPFAITEFCPLKEMPIKKIITVR